MIQTSECVLWCIKSSVGGELVFDLCCNGCVCFCVVLQAMVGILQGKARGGEEESILMHDLKPFRILISLLDKPELGNQFVAV